MDPTMMQGPHNTHDQKAPYKPIGTDRFGSGAGNVNQQILDALTILTTPKMVVDDPNKLRDQFAMAVLPTVASDYRYDPETSCKIAYELADAMIEARGKK